jgi:hypothetical protein
MFPQFELLPMNHLLLRRSMALGGRGQSLGLFQEIICLEQHYAWDKKRHFGSPVGCCLP